MNKLGGIFQNALTPDQKDKKEKNPRDYVHFAECIFNAIKRTV